MHCCGNPLHDIPMNLMWAFPAITAGIWWLRSKFKKKSCSDKCDHINHD
jgi:hypothetical protein